jgi:hypothetical protein
MNTSSLALSAVLALGARGARRSLPRPWSSGARGCRSSRVWTTRVPPPSNASRSPPGRSRASSIASAARPTATVVAAVATAEPRHPRPHSVRALPRLSRRRGAEIVSCALRRAKGRPRASRDRSPALQLPYGARRALPRRARSRRSQRAARREHGRHQGEALAREEIDARSAREGGAPGRVAFGEREKARRDQRTRGAPASSPLPAAFLRAHSSRWDGVLGQFLSRRSRSRAAASPARPSFRARAGRRRARAAGDSPILTRNTTRGVRSANTPASHVGAIAAFQGCWGRAGWVARGLRSRS